MKTRINNNEQLKAEKRRLQQSLQELEEKIGNNWSELRQSMHPSRVWKQFLPINCNKFNEKKEGESFLKSAFNYTMEQAVNVLADKAGEKIEKLFRKK